MKTTKEISAEITKLQNEYPIALKREAQDFVNANRGKWFERNDYFFKILGLSPELFVLVLEINPTYQGIEVTRPTGHFNIEDLKPVNSDYYRLGDFEKQLRSAADEINFQNNEEKKS